MPTQKTLKELLAFLNLKYHAKSQFIPPVQPSDTVNVRAWWPDWEKTHPKNFLSNFFEFVSTCKKSGYFIVHLKTMESDSQREFWSISQEQDFWPYSGWTFWRLLHGKSPPPLKTVTHILQWSNLAQLYLAKRRSRKYMIACHTPWILLKSAFFHQKSADFTV